MPRAYNHDYRDRSFYHITMTKAAGIPAFGHLSGSNIDRSPLGQIIAAHIWLISDLNPSLKLLQYVIMPDHVHFLVQVTGRMDKPLGSYIGMLILAPTSTLSPSRQTFLYFNQTARHLCQF